MERLRYCLGVVFFVAWFWAFFNSSLFPADMQQLTREQLFGGTWPPKGIETFDPWHLPLLNTLILLTSGTTVTWAHHALLENDRQGLKWGLILTIALGLAFTCVQAYEYYHAAFHFSGNIYGATFFMATGFHGAHVIIGSTFLIVCLIRAYLGHFTPTQHLGFEFAAWYWHFVDVVWLFLFACIYVWGAGGEGAAIARRRALKPAHAPSLLPDVEERRLVAVRLEAFAAPILPDAQRIPGLPGDAHVSEQVGQARLAASGPQNEVEQWLCGDRFVQQIAIATRGRTVGALPAMRERQAVRGFLALRPRCENCGLDFSFADSAEARHFSSCSSPGSSSPDLPWQWRSSMRRRTGCTRCSGRR